MYGTVYSKEGTQRYCNFLQNNLIYALLTLYPNPQEPNFLQKERATLRCPVRAYPDEVFRNGVQVDKSW